MKSEGVQAALEILKTFLWTIFEFVKTIWETPLSKAIIIIVAIIIAIVIVIKLIVERIRKKITH